MRPQWDTPLRYLVLVFLLILVIAALWYVREIFQPLITAALIAYFLSPAVGFVVSRFQLKRKTAADLVYFLSLTLFIGFLVSAVPFLLDELKLVTADLPIALSQLGNPMPKPVVISDVAFRFCTILAAL